MLIASRFRRVIASSIAIADRQAYRIAARRLRASSTSGSSTAARGFRGIPETERARRASASREHDRASRAVSRNRSKGWQIVEKERRRFAAAVPAFLELRQRLGVVRAVEVGDAEREAHKPVVGEFPRRIERIDGRWILAVAHRNLTLDESAIRPALYHRFRPACRRFPAPPQRVRRQSPAFAPTARARRRPGKCGERAQWSSGSVRIHVGPPSWASASAISFAAAPTELPCGFIAFRASAEERDCFAMPRFEHCDVGEPDRAQRRAALAARAAYVRGACPSESPRANADIASGR